MISTDNEDFFAENAKNLPTPEPSEVGEDCVAEMLRVGQFWPGAEAVAAMREIVARHQADTLATMQERVGVLEGTLRQIAHITRRQQLPITAEINELAHDALTPYVTEEGQVDE